MTSARNRLQPLSGNSRLLLISIALLAAACSPKLSPVATQQKAEQPVVKKEPEKVIVKPAAALPTATIAMLLPFELDNLAPGAQYTSTSITHADLSLDYYQGFKLALDSLAGKGYNFKLQLFDTKGETAESVSLGYNATIRSSNLIIGPVFPDDMHAFVDILSGPPKLIVSPLSPASPSGIKNANLVTVATPLEYHARAAAQYVEDHYKPKKIFILRSGFSDENMYITPFKKAIDSLTKGSLKIIAPVIQHGQLNGLVPQFSTTEENIFVIGATDQTFLNVTLHSLDSLSKKYKITLFGHPSWAKFSYLKAGMLQDMKTHITSTERVDYKLPAVTDFIKLYRKAYHLEPTHFAMMGFDEGMYFGERLTDGNDGLKLDKTDFTGLLNKYHFVKKPGLGWINTHVNILQYDNSELKRVE